MPPSPEETAKAIERWFAELPPQEHARSVSVLLPGGRGAPSADTLVTLSRVEAGGDGVVVVLDDWMELRFEGPVGVEQVSEDELRLSFTELLVSWLGENPPAPVRYADGTLRFVSGHLVGRADPPPEGVVWENPI
jgi:hypothetical protein